MYSHLLKIISKTIYFTAIYVFVFIAFFAGEAFAAATISLTANPKNLTVSSQNESSVDVIVNTGGASVTTFSIELSYDNSLVEYLRFNLDPKFTQLPNNYGSNGKVVLSGYSITPISSTSAKLATINFKARTTTGAASLKVVNGQIYNSDRTPTQVFSLIGSTGETISIVPASPTGLSVDLNKDSFVNIFDLNLFVTRYKTKTDFSVNFFQDSVIDIKDINEFRKEYILKRTR